MKIKQLMSMGVVAMMALSMPVFAASDLKDSVGSVATDATTETKVGQDVSQNKETVYSGEIQEDKTEEVQVYATQASTFSVTIPKTIIIDGAKVTEGANTGAYVVNVKGNIGGAETITVAPTATFKMNQTGKESLDATVAQTKTMFRVSEAVALGGDNVSYGVDAAEGVTADGVVSVEGLSAGSWAGSFSFNIALNANA